MAGNSRSGGVQQKEESMIEPDWTKAPKWATYFAIDEDGCAWWHEGEPTPKWNSVYGMLEKIGINKNVNDWKNSLVQIKTPTSWQKWIATNEDGEVWAFENKPLKIWAQWVFLTPEQIKKNYKRIQFYGFYLEYASEWEQSLRKRST
jgi:hypothetical protein